LRTSQINGYSLQIILSALLKLLRNNNNNFTDLFIFKGSAFSGIKLQEFNFPKDGYFFFGSIRLETNKNAVIYKFSNLNQNSFIYFGIKNGHFFYETQEGKSFKKSEFSFLKLKVEPGVWYFIELYHINNSCDSQNLVFFLSILYIFIEIICQWRNNKFIFLSIISI